MLWLASYPRSGNTFFRNVLFEVYGIESSTFHNESTYPVDPGYANFPICKTHLLPSELKPRNTRIPAVYLVRDGRDCVVSLAHYRRELHGEDVDFHQCLLEAIDAAGGSYFGGWGEHVRQWLDRASLVIKYEDLIEDPIGCIEQMRPFMDLPEPRVDRLPTFEDLRTKDHKYGSGVEHGFSNEERDRWRKGKFRRGKAGGWQDELPHDLHLRFAAKYGSELIRLGYVDVSPETQAVINRAEAAEAPRTAKPPRKAKKRILIDGVKLLDEQIDGIHRYVRELLEAMYRVTQSERFPWKIDVSLGYAGICPLERVVGDNHSDRGLPSGTVPNLLQHDARNPMIRSRQRLRLIPKSNVGSYLTELIRFKVLSVSRSALKRYLKLKQLFQRVDQRYDLVHVTLPNTWQFFRQFDSPTLMTVHDLSHLVCPHLQTSSNVETLAAGLEWAESRHASYISVSHATQLQMIELLGTPEERIDVVHNSVKSNAFQPVADRDRLEKLRRSYGIPEGRYLLCLGTIEPRKNLGNIIHGFRHFIHEHPQSDLTLVLAGGKGWEDHRELQQAIQSCPQIRYIGYVDDNDLPALYSAAMALCYVSLYEGFGLPILEAMACGTPVIYGDNSSMPEIAGNAGVPADATRPESIAEAIARIVCDEEFRNDLALEAVLRAHCMTWTRAARQTIRSYRHVIGQSKRAGQPQDASAADVSESAASHNNDLSDTRLQQPEIEESGRAAA